MGYAKRYFIDYPKYSAGEWQYGMKEVIEYAEDSPYKNIVMSDRFNQGYIFALFYTQYPPSQYHLDLRQRCRHSFGRYRISSLAKSIKRDDSTLFILRSYEIKNMPKKYTWKVIYAIDEPRGSIRIVLAENQ
jgi:hypothetical protein